MKCFRSSASRPSPSCCAARSDHARHQSSHDRSEAVTSSKSVNVTLLATKRGAQWAMAERTRASCATASFMDYSVRIDVAPSFGGLIGGLRLEARPVVRALLRLPPRLGPLEARAH